MSFLSLALKNLTRHRSRSLLTILGVGIAAATLFIVLSFERGYDQALQEELEGSGIHLFVSTEGCPLEAASLILHGGEIPKFLTMDRLETVRATEGVKAAAGFLIFSLTSDSGDKVDLFYGVTDDARKLKPNWNVKGQWFQDEDSIILGSEVARVEKREVGDKIYIENLDREFEVVGILERTYGQDDGFLFLPLATAQKLFKKENKLTAVGVQLAELFQLQNVKDRLETMPDVYVVTSEQINQEVVRFIGGSKALMYALLVVALALSALGVLNTILMATFERREEFAHLRCVGAKRRHLVELVLLEAAFVCFIGWAVGTVGGFAFSSSAEAWIRQFLAYVPAGALLRPTVAVISFSLGLTMLLGLLAAMYPAFRVSQVAPAEAMKYE